MSGHKISKKCTKCNVVYPLENFTRLARTSDKHAYQCKHCSKREKEIYRSNIEVRTREAARKRLWRESNREEYLEKERERNRTRKVNREDKRRYNVRAKERALEKYKASNPVTLCKGCGVEFCVLRTSGRVSGYCCTECRRRSAYSYDPDASLERNKANHRAHSKPKSCSSCGVLFSRLYGNKSSTCSDDCSDALKRKQRRVARSKRKALERGASVGKPVDPIAVLERDGWRCQLCGVKTPKRLRGTYDNRAPEVDHILPLSLGGAHTYDNVQCACRSCNGVKSNIPRGQLQMFCDPVCN